MKRKYFQLLATIVIAIIMIITMAGTVMAQVIEPQAELANSVVVVLQEDMNLVPPNSTVHYSVILTNLNVTGASPATVTVTFFPPGPTGAIGEYGPAVVLDTNVSLNVGETIIYNYNGSGVPPPNTTIKSRTALAVNLGAIPLNQDVVVAYANTTYIANYNPPPPNNPFTAEGEKNIPLTVLRPNTTTTISAASSTIYSGGNTNLSITERNTGNVDLTSASVTVTSNGTPPLNIILNNSSPNFTSNQNTDNILATNEIWTWTLNTGSLTMNTTFTATGTGTDPLNNVITYPGYPLERASVPITVISPNTVTEIGASASTIETGTATTLTIRERNTGNVSLTDASVLVTSNEAIPMNITLNSSSPNFTSNQNTDNILSAGEIWTWSLITSNLSADTTFTATGTGKDPLDKIITFPEYQFERTSVPVNVISPGTSTTMIALAPIIQKNTNTSLTVRESNTGDVPLTNASVRLTSDGVPPMNIVLNNQFPGFASNQNSDSTLDVDEVWTWTLGTGNLAITTNFTAIGTGTDPLTKQITYPEFQSERAQVSVSVIGPDTLVTITPAESVIVPGSSVSLVVTEKNTGTPDVPLTNASVTVTASPAVSGFPVVLNNSSPGFSSNQDNDAILEKDEVWSWTLNTGNLSSTTDFIAIGTGTDPIGNIITYPEYPRERFEAKVIANSPNTKVTITSPPNNTGQVTLTVTEKNTGNVPLNNVSVAITSTPSVLTLTLNRNSPGFSSNLNNDDVLDPGEEWTWPLGTGILTSDTTFVATGSGTDPLGNVITFRLLPNGQFSFPEEQDRVLVRAVLVPASSVFTNGFIVAGLAALMSFIITKKSRDSASKL